MKAHISGWLRPSTTPTRCVVRSEAYELQTHFVAGIGSARCQVGGCELCSQLGEAKTTLVHVVERGGALLLLELNCDAMERPLVLGDVVVIQRRKLGDMNETFIRRDGFEPGARVWPSGYLAALGQKQYERAVKAKRMDDFAI